MQVKIYQPTKSPTQSGRKNNFWLVEPIIEDNYKSISSLTGWTSSQSAISQLKLKFNSKEDAIKYAKNNSWAFNVVEPQSPAITKKSYADNFIKPQ